MLFFNLKVIKKSHLCFLRIQRVSILKMIVLALTILFHFVLEVYV